MLFVSLLTLGYVVGGLLIARATYVEKTCNKVLLLQKLEDAGTLRWQGQHYMSDSARSDAVRRERENEYLSSHSYYYDYHQPYQLEAHLKNERINNTVWFGIFWWVALAVYLIKWIYPIVIKPVRILFSSAEAKGIAKAQIKIDENKKIAELEKIVKELSNGTDTNAS